MRQRAYLGAAGCALWLALGAAGCATTPAPAPGTVTSPIPGHEPEPVHTHETAAGAVTPTPAPATATQVGTTASGGTITQTGGSPTDSGPSAEAQAVLRTIPDPVPGSETGQSSAPPPANPSTSGGTGAAAAGAGAAAAGAGIAAAARPDSAAADTASVAADTSSVPTPALTEALGEHPGAHVVTDPAVPAGATGTAQAAPPPAQPNPAPAGPCWRVQVAAVPEQARAKALRDAAQSQLGGEWVIDLEKKLYKVRTKECIATEAADRIKQHAIDDGFKGAFRYKPTP